MAKDLIEAIKEKKIAEIKEIISHDEKAVTKKGKDNLFPLVHAVNTGNAEIVKMLLDAGADPQTLNAMGYPVVTDASYSGYTDIVKLLIDTVDWKSPTGTVFLIGAASQGHLDIIKLAIEHGANVNADDGIGRTPLDYAKEAGHKDIVNFLKKAGAKSETKKPEKEEKEFIPKIHSKPIPGAKKISLKEASELLKGIAKFTKSHEQFEFTLCPSDVTISGNLELAENEVLIVQGNLMVKKALIDFFYNEDDYSQIFVLGDLTSTDLITGSPIYVKGNVAIEHMIYANSFGLDSLVVKGKLTAKVLIDEGHEIDCNHIDVNTIYTTPDRISDYSKFKQVKEITPEIFVSPKLYSDNGVNPEELYKYISSGKPIVKGV